MDVKLNKESRTIIELMIADGIISRDDAEKYFPELKESEDERIRKSLIKSYTNQHSSNFPTVDGFTREQILAWLEKQGDKTLKNEVIIEGYDKLSEFERKFDDIADKYAFNKNNEGYNQYWYVKERANEMLFQAKKELEKQSSQNLANSAKSCKDEQNPAWSEEDENKLRVVISFVNSNPAQDPFYDKRYLTDFLKSLKERYTCKPSDEQIETLNEVIKEAAKMGGRLSKYSKKVQCLESLYNVLKKLKG